MALGASYLMALTLDEFFSNGRSHSTTDNISILIAARFIEVA
jgi:hypothetical protein